MKTFKLSKNSLWYKFLNKLGIVHSYDEGLNFCYIAKELAGMSFAACFVSVIVLLILFCEVKFIILSYQVLFNGLRNYEGPGEAAAFWNLCVLVIWISNCISNWISNWISNSITHKFENNATDVEKQPSFIVQVYRSFRDKVCVKIELTE